MYWVPGIRPGMKIRPEDEVSSLGDSPSWLGSTESWGGEGVYKYKVNDQHKVNELYFRYLRATQQAEKKASLTHN